MIKMGDIVNAVIVQHTAHPVGGAFGPAGDDWPFSALLQFVYVGAHSGENIDVLGSAFGGKTASGFGLHGKCPPTIRGRKGRQMTKRRAFKVGQPFLAFKIERGGLKRAISGRGKGGFLSRCIEGFIAEILSAGIVIIFDRGQSLIDRLLCQRVHHQQRGVHKIKQRIDIRIKQRKPMFHARMSPPGTDRFIDGIIMGGPEGCNI